MFFPGNDKQAGDFNANFEFVANDIKKTHIHGNDVAETLQILTKKAKNGNNCNPQLAFSAKTGKEEKKAENNQFEMKCKAELDQAMKRKSEHD